jgi:hypothetical protein
MVKKRLKNALAQRISLGERKKAIFGPYPFLVRAFTPGFVAFIAKVLQRFDYLFAAGNIDRIRKVF